MKVEQFQVLLDSPGAVYCSGQELTGRVMCRNNDIVTCRSIRMKIKGEASVSWKANKGDDSKTYNSSQKYFAEQIHLFGKGDRSELGPGEHYFRFSYRLPENLPNSVELENGNIRYWIKAVMDLPWQSDVKTKKFFSVRSDVDVRSDPESKERLTEEKVKRLCCLCCQSGPIHIRCWIDGRAFVPGDAIHFSAEIFNHSHETMEKSTVKLVQKVTYYAEGRSRQEQEILFKHQRPSFDKEDFWSDFPITVPAVPPSPFLHCKIMDVNYFVQFSLVPGGCSGAIKVPLKVLIGTVPFQHDQNHSDSDPPAIGTESTALSSRADLPLASEPSVPGGSVPA